MATSCQSQSSFNCTIMFEWEVCLLLNPSFDPDIYTTVDFAGLPFFYHSIQQQTTVY